MVTIRVTQTQNGPLKDTNTTIQHKTRKLWPVLFCNFNLTCFYRIITQGIAVSPYGNKFKSIFRHNYWFLSRLTKAWFHSEYSFHIRIWISAESRSINVLPLCLGKQHFAREFCFVVYIYRRVCSTIASSCSSTKMFSSLQTEMF